MPRWKPSRAFSAMRALFLHPTGAPARHVGGFQILLGERLACPEVTPAPPRPSCDARGPRLVHAAAGQHVGAAGTFADARVAIARQERLAAHAGFLQRFRAPTAQLAALQVPPEIRMQHVVLQVAIGGAHRAPEPRGDEDADGGHAVGMHVEEAEDLRFGIAERVEDRAGFQRSALGQIHHHLHAHRPFALVVAFGQAELRIELPPHRAHRPIAHHRQRGAYVHAGQEAGLGIAVLIHALIDEADSQHPLVFDQRFLYRHSGPDLHRAGGHQLPADMLQELSQRHHQAALLVQEWRNVGQLHGMLAEPPRARESCRRQNACAAERRLAPCGSSR